MNTPTLITTLCLVITCTVSCGQKGALYLPQTPAQKQSTPKLEHITTEPDASISTN